MTDRWPGSWSGRSSRRRVLGAGAAALVVGLAACGGDEAVRPPDPAPATPGGTPVVVGPVPGFDDPQRWAGRTLRVGAWGGEVQAGLRTAVWDPFAAATGCAIEEATTDYSQLDAAVRAATFFADVLVVDEIWAHTALDRRQITPFDLGAAAADLLPTLPAAAGSVPAYAYALVGAYRRDAITADPPASWSEWWDADRFPGRRAMARDPYGTFEFALLSDGVAADALYPLDGERAIARLAAISGQIVDQWWDSGAQPVGWLGSSRVDFATAWHYRVVAGQQDGLAIDFAWDYGLLHTDRWVVPAGVAEPEMALDFLRYALSTPVQAALALTVPLGPVVGAAFERIDARTATALPTAPGTLGRLLRPDVAWWAAHEGEAVQRFNSWLLGAVGA